MTTNNTNTVKMNTLESLPAELQLKIFGFAYRGRQFHIDEKEDEAYYNWLSITTRDLTEQREMRLLEAENQERAKFHQAGPGASRKQLLDTIISRATYTVASEAHLTSSTWNFASVAAAEIHTENHPSTIRYIQKLRAVAGESHVRHLVRTLSEAGSMLHSVELIDCIPAQLGAAHSDSAAAQYTAMMQRNGAEVVQQCIHPCRGLVMTSKSFAACPLIQTLTGIPTLERVDLSVSCYACDMVKCTECAWILHARETELFVLQAVAASEGVVASQERSRNIANLQATITKIKANIAARKQSESVG